MHEFEAEGLRLGGLNLGHGCGESVKTTSASIGCLPGQSAERGFHALVFQRWLSCAGCHGRSQVLTPVVLRAPWAFT